MGKALVIAEKPSVAGDIAKALGGFTRQKDYFESDEYIVCSAVGHLLELKCPEEFEVKRGKWTFPNLPVIPEHFDLAPIAKSEDKLKTIKRLAKSKEVDTLINACDAGREGELIFRYIVQHIGSKKPIKRLWLQSMTAQAIKDGFKRLRDDQVMLPLADAAVCRSESDWIVGINGTRAMTAFNSKSGGFHLTTVGRVQTPTLTIVVEREEAIRKFVSRDYWEVHGTFQAEAGTYVGRWIDESFKREKDGDAELRAERLWDKSRAEAVRDKCQGKPGIVTEESKPSTSAAPLLYDLTSLQREANSRFGFSADRTLRIAQALYERHKVLTYPRTDARALPEDYPATVRKTLQDLSAAGMTHADPILQNNWINPNNKRVFNNAKITDHFAIIPTGAKKVLKDDEAKLYDMVAKRFLAVFYPPAEYRITTRITRVVEEAFKTEGKVLVKAGWLAVYGRDTQSANKDKDELCAVKDGEQVETQSIEIMDFQTKPPPRYSEATLLSAMEGAGKFVEDDELREAMSAKGLGTPATRASIIENLIREVYLIREHRELIPTPKAFSLITLLRGLDVAELCRPELTGDWEYKLKEMEAGRLDRAAFMKEIADMTRRIVQRAKEYESDTVPGDFGELKTPCPKCGGKVKETYKKFQCSTEGCDFANWKIMGGRQFSVEEMDELLANRQVGPLQGFRSRQGFNFNAILKLDEENKVQFDFGESDKAKEDAEPVDFSDREALGPCPKCGANVYEHGLYYVCEKSVGPEKSCDFRSGKIILQKEIPAAQIKKLLAEKKTDLIEKFISKKGRPFNAFLVISPKKDVGFEFEERKTAAKKGAKGAAAKDDKPKEKIDFTGKPEVGKCPRCGGTLYELEDNYLCENSQADTRACKFKCGRNIAGQDVSREQLAKILEKGKSDLLESFVSKRGNAFKAWLVLEGPKSTKKVGFEFPPRD